MSLGYSERERASRVAKSESEIDEGGERRKMQWRSGEINIKCCCR